MCVALDEELSYRRQVKRAELYAATVRQAEAQLLLRVETLQEKTSEGGVAGSERQQRQKEAREEADILRRGLSMMVREGDEGELCQQLHLFRKG